MVKVDTIDDLLQYLPTTKKFLEFLSAQKGSSYSQNVKTLLWHILKGDQESFYTSYEKIGANEEHLEDLVKILTYIILDKVAHYHKNNCILPITREEADTLISFLEYLKNNKKDQNKRKEWISTGTKLLERLLGIKNE